MTRTLIIGASGGIGRALMQDAQSRGDDVVGLSRSAGGLDLTDEQSVSAGLGRLDGAYVRIIVATGPRVSGGQGPEKDAEVA